MFGGVLGFSFSGLYGKIVVCLLSLSFSSNHDFMIINFHRRVHLDLEKTFWVQFPGAILVL